MPKIAKKLRAFQTSNLLQTIKKLKGYPLETLKIFFKCLRAEKKSKVDPLVSSGFVLG